MMLFVDPQGVTVYTLVRVTGIVGVVLDKLEYLSTNGTVLATYTLFVTTYDSNIYYTDAHVCPDGVFVIQVSEALYQSPPFV